MQLEKDRIAKKSASLDATGENFAATQEIAKLEERLFQLEQAKGELRQTRDKLSGKSQSQEYELSLLTSPITSQIITMIQENQKALHEANQRLTDQIRMQEHFINEKREAWQSTVQYLKSQLEGSRFDQSDDL